MPRPERPAAPRSTSNPHLKAMSAERTSPVPAPEQPKKAIGDRVKSEVANSALNVASLVKEGVNDFNSKDKFFKYKVFIAAGWLALVVASIAVAWPGSTQKTSDLGARVVINDQVKPAVLMIQNEGNQAWTDVVVIVNKNYRASVEQVAPRDSITLTPKLLMGPGGKLAPKDLRYSDVELRVGEDKSPLLVSGIIQ